MLYYLLLTNTAALTHAHLLALVFLFISINPGAKNKKKTSPIKSIHTYLTGTKSRDVDESSLSSKVRRNNDKPKLRKENKTMSKIGRQEGVLLEGKLNSPTKSAF